MLDIKFQSLQVLSIAERIHLLLVPAALPLVILSNFWTTGNESEP